ncbi:MAG: AAA family ATPase [Candidatus Absconditabacterales bacterium]
MALKISVSGPAGSGKSSIINAIVEKYGMQTIDAGKTFFRDRAVARGLVVSEYDKIVEANPQEDVAIDNEMKQFVENCPGDVIVGWRMGFHLMPDIISVRLDVSPEQGAERVFLADRGAQEKKYNTVEEALKANQDRMSKLRERLLKVYNVDFTDKSNYTKVIDTTDKNFEQVLKEFEEFIETLK